MKSLLIAIKPKWCAKIMNGEKTIEVRKNKALATAIQKLIDENGYAEIYVYCSKEKEQLTSGYSSVIKGTKYFIYNDDEAIDYRGKVVFKFRCYKVEEIDYTYLVNARSYFIQSCLTANHFSKKCCLEQWELDNYLNGKKGYAIHISDLEIFDEPKEISEFRHYKRFDCYNADFDYTTIEYRQIRLTKAPQNFCYIESEE